MKLMLMSDLHGHLPKSLPDADAILIAGDICGGGKAVQQLEWLDDHFRRWLEQISIPTICVGGNHDWAMYEKLDEVRRLKLPWTYLQDESMMFQGKVVYGSPHQRKFYDWAFNLEEYQLAGKWNLIPDETNILICHSPPKFYGDKTRDGEFCGSESLTWRIGQLKQLQLVCFGHIHSGYGTYNSGNVTLANASLLNESYQMVNSPIVIEID